MADFVETLGLVHMIAAAGENPSDNFEAIYSRLHKVGKIPVLEEIEAATYSYFQKLALPNHPTLYDHLILSLRKKDLIVTFNWDPLLPQAYKRWRHLGDVLPIIAFLHGNVDLGVDRNKKVSGFLSDEPYSGRKLAPTLLLYPVGQKDYNSDPFIAEQWKMATDYLREAYYVTIFGYSAPATDIEARDFLLKAWRENATKVLAQFEVIDIRDKKMLKTHGQISLPIFMAEPHRVLKKISYSDTLVGHVNHSLLLLSSKTLGMKIQFQM
jgi:hypothetical protein